MPPGWFLQSSPPGKRSRRFACKHSRPGQQDSNSSCPLRGPKGQRVILKDWKILKEFERYWKIDTSSIIIFHSFLPNTASALVYGFLRWPLEVTKYPWDSHKNWPVETPEIHGWESKISMGPPAIQQYPSRRKKCKKEALKIPRSDKLSGLHRFAA